MVRAATEEVVGSVTESGFWGCCRTNSRGLRTYRYSKITSDIVGGILNASDHTQQGSEGLRRPAIFEAVVEMIVTVGDTRRHRFVGALVLREPGLQQTVDMNLVVDLQTTGSWNVPVHTPMHAMIHHKRVKPSEVLLLSKRLSTSISPSVLLPVRACRCSFAASTREARRVVGGRNNRRDRNRYTRCLRRFLSNSCCAFLSNSDFWEEKWDMGKHVQPFRLGN